MYQLKRFTLNANDISFLEQQVSFPTIHIVGYDSAGQPLYGYDGSDGNVHVLGLLGSFNPLDTPPGEAVWYNGARDPIGLRNVSGHFNNLTQDGQSWAASAEFHSSDAFGLQSLRPAKPEQCGVDPRRRCACRHHAPV